MGNMNQCSCFSLFNPMTVVGRYAGSTPQVVHHTEWTAGDKLIPNGVRSYSFSCINKLPEATIQVVILTLYNGNGGIYKSHIHL